MSKLATLKVDDSNVQGETDSVGGGSRILDSDIYEAKVTMAYLQESQGGAMGLNLHLETTAGQEIRQTLWVTSGRAKGQLPYFEKDGERKFLPGYNHANALCLLTVGKELHEMDTDEKMLNIYSFEAQSEVPTKVDVVTELLGEEIHVAIEKQIVDKRAKGDDGNYHATGETREVNEIDKIFRHGDKMTTTEILAEAEEATFFDTWISKKAGQVRDRSTGASGNTGAPKAAGNKPAGSPKKKLFGQKS